MKVDAGAVRRRLLRWYEHHRRPLPWRRTRDPYRIWVAEVMLQQTQVAKVVPYYQRFVERFPAVSVLAQSSEEAVLAAWSGLGYYRRARLLHRAAKLVVERYGGRLPADPAQLQALPGVGRYTAGALASIAFGVPVPVLDGNVRRVLARLFGERRPRERVLWERAGRLVQGRRPGELNQALMELGATLCKPRLPRCSDCPLDRACAARTRGNPERYPEPRRRPPAQRVTVAVAWIERGGRVLLERKDAGPLRGLWDLPATEVDGGSAAQALAACLAARYDLEVVTVSRAATLRHAVMSRRMDLEAYRCRLRRGRTAHRPDLRWVPRDELFLHAVSAATRKVAARFLVQSAYGRSHGGTQVAEPRGGRPLRSRSRRT